MNFKKGTFLVEGVSGGEVVLPAKQISAAWDHEDQQLGKYCHVVLMGGNNALRVRCKARDIWNRMTTDVSLVNKGGDDGGLEPSAA